jgi:tRNA A-37 threonylcarbamoyl transferase component Bud32
MQRLSAADLLQAGFELPEQFCLPLGIGANARELECQQVLRWLPGRRLVARIWLEDADGGRIDAVLKLFLGPDARRYRARELAGLERLTAAGARVPELLDRFDDEPDQALGLVFGFVPGSRPIRADERDAMKPLVECLASLHQRGVDQQDLKLDNFLLADDQIWMIDGDGVVGGRRALSPRSSLAGLSRLLAERAPAHDDDLADLAAAYCRVRSWPCSAGWQQRLQLSLYHARRRRLRRYAGKTLRDCSEFLVTRRPGHYSVRRRGWQNAAWEVFVADPERVMDQARVIKAGNSATVVRWKLQQGDSLVIKRYNLKSTWHALRRTLNPRPRFRTAWTAGQLLNLLGVPTAQPGALLERRLGFGRNLAYLVMPDLGDRSLELEISESGLSLQRGREVAALFAALRAAGLRHGDAKASNFLISEDRLHWVDLDALRADRDGWRRDVARFLDNWDGDIRRGFELALADRQLLP